MFRWSDLSSSYLLIMKANAVTPPPAVLSSAIQKEKETCATYSRRVLKQITKREFLQSLQSIQKWNDQIINSQENEAMFLKKRGF